MQERTGWPSRCTVQAPHSAIPQPNFVPVRPIASRRAHNSGVSAGRSTVCRFPLMSRGIIAALLFVSSLNATHGGWPEAPLGPPHALPRSGSRGAEKNHGGTLDPAPGVVNRLFGWPSARPRVSGQGTDWNEV